MGELTFENHLINTICEISLPQKVCDSGTHCSEPGWLSGQRIETYTDVSTQLTNFSVSW